MGDGKNNEAAFPYGDNGGLDGNIMIPVTPLVFSVTHLGGTSHRLLLLLLGSIKKFPGRVGGQRDRGRNRIPSEEGGD